MSHAPAASSEHLPLDPSIRLRLSVMMFLQYFAWGAWFVTLGTYIGSNTGDGKIFAPGFIGRAYGSAAIAGMIAPFFVGMIADRYFSTERILAVLHLLGAGVLYYASTVQSQTVFYGTLITFFLCYMPTLALTNSLSFHHLTDPGRQFPGIRVLGTLGWIVAGNLVGYIQTLDGKYSLVVREFMGIPLGGSAEVVPGMTGIEGTSVPMVIAAASQVLLALFCLVLPHTPPSNPTGQVTVRAILGIDALQLMKRWPFAVFVVGSFLIAIPLQFYYNYTNFFLNKVDVPNAAAKMSYGQMSEVVFMLLMPLFFARLGVKKMLLFGMLAWAVRYVLFAFGRPETSMWMLYGGILLHGICYDFFFVTGQIYVDREADNKIRGAAQGFIAFVTLGLGSFIGAEFSGLMQQRFAQGDSVDWQPFWLVPAAFAGVVMVLFAVLFNDKPQAEK
ncbi:MAG: nucleoside permease [Planctomycetaceae bacterium]|nr:nucleoside permease [Planctomycetaceae bacterium]